MRRVRHLYGEILPRLLFYVIPRELFLHAQPVEGIESGQVADGAEDGKTGGAFADPHRDSVIIPRAVVRARERVEKRRLADVGIADQ